jgi:hypothetical protein
LKYNIIYDIMDKKKIRRLRSRLERLRGGVANLKREDLVGFAEALGRVRSRRGKEGTYISSLLPHSRPISIPKHRTFNKFTAGNILDAFEQDLFALEEETGE